MRNAREITVTAVSETVLCAVCDGDLVAVRETNCRYTRLVVEPCKDCLESAKEEGAAKATAGQE